MKYRADMHVHSTFSIDSTCSMEEHTQLAIEKGYKYICFTEHVDFNPFDEGVGFFQYEAYSKEIDRLNELYASKLTILKGMEFSEPYLYPKEFEAYTKLDFDYILASIHFLDDFFILDKERTKNFTQEKLFERYYTEMMKLVAYGGFDCVAHFDYIRRGSGSDLFVEDVLSSIFSVMAKNQIGIEINTQNYRRGIELPFPTPQKAELFAKSGGTCITFGSDGHHKGDLGSGIDLAFDFYASIPGLTPGIFIKRKFQAI